MEIKELKSAWGSFIEDPKYNVYLMNLEEIQYDYLQKVKEFIDENKQRPSSKNNYSWYAIWYIIIYYWSIRTRFTYKVVNFTKKTSYTVHIYML